MEKLYNNKYFKFFSKFFVFIFILWVLDFSIGTLLKYLLRKTKIRFIIQDYLFP